MMDKDPVSGNEIPAGGTAEGVRDDITVNVSEGEYVIPENVVRYIGVEKLEKMVAKAQMDLEEMDASGRMGDNPEMPQDDMEEAVGLEFAEGGLVPNYPQAQSDWNPQNYGLGFSNLGGTGQQSSMYGPYTPKPAQEQPAAAPVPVEAASKEQEPEWFRDGNRSYEQGEGPQTNPNAWMDKFEYETTTPQGLFEASMKLAEGGGGLLGGLEEVGEVAEDFGLKGISKLAQDPFTAIGALTGNPLLGLAGKGISKMNVLNDISTMNANAIVLEAAGEKDLANQLREAAGQKAKENGLENAAERFATGQNRAKNIMETHQNLFGGGTTPAAAGGTGRDVVPTSSLSTSPTPAAARSGGTGGDLEDRNRGSLSFGSSVSGTSGNTGLGGTTPSPNTSLGFSGSSGSSTPSTGSFGTYTSDLDMGSTSSAPSNSVSTSAGDLDMGTSVDDKDDGYNSSGRDGYGYGLAKGGLVTKKMKQKPTNKQKRGLGRK